MTLAADIVHRNHQVFHHLPLHAEVIERELRSATREIWICKVDSRSNSGRGASCSITGSEGLPGARIISSPLKLTGGRDRRNGRQNKSRATEICILRRECRVAVEIKSRSSRSAGSTIGERRRTVEAGLPSSRRCPTRTSRTAGMGIKNSPPAPEDRLLIRGIRKAQARPIVLPIGVDRRAAFTADPRPAM